MPTIAIVGASADRSKFGNKAVRAYAAKGYDVFPVHPRAEQIEGFRVYSSVADIPAATIDRVSLYVPRDVALKVLDAIATKTIGEVWLNPGADDPQVAAKATRLGLNVHVGCSIVDIGVSPAQFPD